MPLFYSSKRKHGLRRDACSRGPKIRLTPPVRFVRVEVMPGPGAALEITLSVSRILRIPADFDAAALARLLPVVQARTAAEGAAC